MKVQKSDYNRYTFISFSSFKIWHTILYTGMQIYSLPNRDMETVTSTIWQVCLFTGLPHKQIQLFHFCFRCLLYTSEYAFREDYLMGRYNLPICVFYWKIYNPPFYFHILGLDVSWCHFGCTFILSQFSWPTYRLRLGLGGFGFTRCNIPLQTPRKRVRTPMSYPAIYMGSRPTDMTRAAPPALKYGVNPKQ